MNNKVALSMVLDMLLISALMLVFNVQVTEGGATIYIRADGSIDPPSANITSADNVTYTFTDNNYDSIIVERDNIIIDGVGYKVKGTGSGSGITLTGRVNISIRNMEIRSFTYCIDLSESSYSTVAANNITGQSMGIRMWGGSNNTLLENNIAASSGWGIDVYGSSNNTIFGNTVTGNWYGMTIHGNNHSISNNNLSNNYFGIKMTGVSNSILTENNLTNNDFGVHMDQSNFNTITGNRIQSNSQYGIYLYAASNNSIYHNNFVNNANQVVSYSTNVWDNGYPSGGNYWSDYSGQDLNGDGLGDTALPHQGVDYYPLMSPWPRHEIAIINVTLSTTKAIKGQIVEVNVVAMNWGGFADTFNVTAYYNDTIIETREISGLAPDTEISLIFNWNTTDVSGGYYYTISANTSTIAGEIYITNNAFVNGVIEIINPIRIVEVIPCNQTGYPKDSFEQGTIAYFKVTINSTALIPQDTLITINLYDNASITIGVVSFQGPVLPGTSTIIFGLPIPTTATIGTATIYANCYTDWPSQSGFPHCPETSATLEIIGP